MFLTATDSIRIIGEITLDSANEGQEPSEEPGWLVFSSYGHVLGLVDGVLFGTGQPPRRSGPATSTWKLPQTARTALPGKIRKGTLPAG